MIMLIAWQLNSCVFSDTISYGDGRVILQKTPHLDVNWEPMTMEDAQALVSYIHLFTIHIHPQRKVLIGFASVDSVHGRKTVL